MIANKGAILTVKRISGLPGGQDKDFKGRPSSPDPHWKWPRQVRRPTNAFSTFRWGCVFEIKNSSEAGFERELQSLQWVC